MTTYSCPRTGFHPPSPGCSAPRGGELHNHFRLPRFVLSLAATAAMLSCPHTTSADANASSAFMRVDKRGMIEIPGVLKQDSKTHWGFVNLIIFGDNWTFSAQDYAAKNHRKEAITGPDNKLLGVSLTADITAGSRPLKITQTTTDVSKGDTTTMHVKWKLANPDGKPMGCEKAFILIPLNAKEFASGTITDGKGATLTLPADKGPETLAFTGDKSSLQISGAAAALAVGVTKGQVVICDERAAQSPADRFALRVEFDDMKNASEAEVEFDLAGAFLGAEKKAPGKIDFQAPKPPAKIVAGDQWTPFSFHHDVKPGTILDFSSLHTDNAPAGKYGRVIVNPDGHYAFEKKPGERVRFVGANLCYSANFLQEHDRIDRLAETFRLLGYNTMRFHHTDVSMMKGEWSAWNTGKTGEIDTNQLDRIDYTLAAFKKVGIYVTFDFYAMGSYDVNGKPWAQMKARLPIDEDAFQVWVKNVMQWMNHVNPYTGVAWKDDPAVINICPINEDSIASAWWGAKDQYNALFEEWKKTCTDAASYDDKALFARFLTEVKAKSNRKIQDYFRAQGIPALFSGCNWWDTQAQTFERDVLEVVDNHHYADHPKEGDYSNPRKKPAVFDQVSTLKSGNLTYMVPNMKSSTRIFGKPFIITEYNFCPPNFYRCEAGATMGAYAALQDWDALYRFAWSHGDKDVDGVWCVNGFNVARDPIGVLSERLVVLLFGRGDVSPATDAYVYGVTMRDATKQGVGDMWAKGLFPHRFNSMGVISRIGSQVVEGDRPVKGTFRGVVAGSSLNEKQLGGFPQIELSALPDTGKMSEIASDTKQVFLNNKKGYLRVNTPRTAAIVAPGGIDLTAGPLSVSKNSTFSSVSASAMDRSDLASSTRILLLHLTNVMNSNTTFRSSDYKVITDWGELPYLARVGSADVTLANTNPDLTLYAINPDGTRGKKLPATYANGAYSFHLAIESGDKDATMMYELGK